ncbi:hypothetical protein OSB04_016399 [Centaurea solstitialis]|uniref:Transposase n=1 Tax=Centaurea solstitialis TaxID=347529 RepID=A0AA38T2H8_9ASTR|nr:hypothetical protein OSB04_016399 [Centaurea solstitialis]
MEVKEESQASKSKKEALIEEKVAQQHERKREVAGDRTLQQQQQQGQQQADDEEEDRTTNRGCADDEAHVFNLSFAGIALDNDEEDEEDDDEEDDEGVTLREGVNDYFEMPVFVPTLEVSTTTNQTVPYNRSSRIKNVKFLKRKNEMIIELGIKCLPEGFEHRTHRSSKDRYKVLCVNSGCALRACVPTMFHLRNFNDVHTCSRTQLNSNHRQATKKVLGALKKQKFLRANRTYQPRDIVDDINQQFGLSIGYATGLHARWNALDSIRGSPSESFTRLPAYLYTNLNEGRHEGHFEECFVALGVAIHIFLQNLRRVLIIDAAHLKGPYLGTMFLVVAMDGNNNIVPIAFGVGKSETSEE